MDPKSVFINKNSFLRWEKSVITNVCTKKYGKYEIELVVERSKVIKYEKKIFYACKKDFKYDKCNNILKKSKEMIHSLTLWSTVCPVRQHLLKILSCWNISQKSRMILFTFIIFLQIAFTALGIDLFFNSGRISA